MVPSDHRQGFNPHTRMVDIVEKAGHEPWPKVFINLQDSTGLVVFQSVTPTGLEQSSETRGNCDIDARGGNVGGNTDAQTVELLALWEAMDDDARDYLLRVARGLRA
jgi:hypothetical protein